MRIGFCAIKFLIPALLGMAAFSVLASEGASLSKAAERFIDRGADFVLKDCRQPLPVRACSQGKLVRVGPLQRLVDSNSGERFTYQEFEFAGMRYDFRDGRVVILTVTGSQWPAYSNLGVGSARSKVLAALGRPTSLDGSMVEYCKESVSDCVTFTFDRTGVATSVSWGFYYD